jgi:hypothetical protein
LFGLARRPAFVSERLGTNLNLKAAQTLEASHAGGSNTNQDLHASPPDCHAGFNVCKCVTCPFAVGTKLNKLPELNTAKPKQTFTLQPTTHNPQPTITTLLLQLQNLGEPAPLAPLEANGDPDWQLQVRPWSQSVFLFFVFVFCFSCIPFLVYGKGLL